MRVQEGRRRRNGGKKKEDDWSGPNVWGGKTKRISEGTLRRVSTQGGVRGNANKGETFKKSIKHQDNQQASR